MLMHLRAVIPAAPVLQYDTGHLAFSLAVAVSCVLLSAAVHPQLQGSKCLSSVFLNARLIQEKLGLCNCIMRPQRVAVLEHELEFESCPTLS
jgi:hypothetical protein